MSQHKTKALLFAGQNNTDPQREKEFNEWYDRVHAYDSLDTPGITAYQRYRNVDPQPGEPSYLSMSELDTEDIAAVQDRRREIMAQKAKQGHATSFEGMKVVFYHTYRRIF